jgi:hypothetical protein
MPVTIGIIPLTSIIKMKVEFSEALKREVNITCIKISIIESPNTKLVMREVIAALVSALRRSISEASTKLSLLVIFGFG